MEEFKEYLKLEKKSQQTIDNYILAVNIYKKWLKGSTNSAFTKLHRENIIDFIFYLRKIKKTKKGTPLRAESINQYISGLVKFNEFLVEIGKQKEIVITYKDKIKVQRGGINPCKVTNEDVKEFRQKILDSDCRSKNEFERIRNYCLVCLLEFTGIRVSEAINIELTDYNLDSKELIIRNGKGDKERVVFFNTKVKNAIEELLKVRKNKGNYLFNTRQSEKMSRSSVEKLFKKHSNVLTPHQERHNFGSSRLSNYGIQQNSSEDEEKAKYTVAEIQFLLGHSSIKSTQVYLNPSIKAMKEKAEMNI